MMPRWTASVRERAASLPMMVLRYDSIVASLNWVRHVTQSYMIVMARAHSTRSSCAR